MKKKMYLLGSLSLLIFSCKKDYACVCVQTMTQDPVYYNGQLEMEGSTSTYTVTQNISRSKKKDAEAKCSNNEGKAVVQGYYSGGGYTGGDMTTEVTCDLNSK